jgi:hypothetical protein
MFYIKLLLDRPKGFEIDWQTGASGAGEAIDQSACPGIYLRLVYAPFYQ